MARAPKKTGGSAVPIPMAVQPTSSYGRVFDPSDIKPLMVGAELLLPEGVDVAAIADELDNAASWFVGNSRVFAASPAGDSAAWAREVERRARALLNCFTQAEDGGDLLEAATFALRGPSYLEVDGHLVDTRSALQETLPRVHALEHYAGLAAAAYEKRMGSKRRIPVHELAFVHALAGAYHTAFGKDWGLSSGKENAPAGTAVRFCMAVAAHVEARLPDISFRDSAIQAALRRLKTAQGAADRVRDVRGGGKGRKR